MSNEQILALVFSVLPFVLFLGGLLLWRWLKEDGSPANDVLLPYAAAAIIMAYKASEEIMDATAERLRGPEKQILARSAYDLLPPFIKAQFSYLIFIERIDPLIEWALTKYEVHREHFGVMLQEEFSEDADGESVA